MCEIEPYARGVLSRHWPGVPIFDDVRTLTGEQLRAFEIDVITGGFPCQDISLAGKGAGITGARSGLWVEMFRVISEVRPSWVVVENVSALRSRGLDTVLGALASIGYDAEWHCIPASSFGSPHRRDRVWVVAYPQSARSENYEGQPGPSGPPRRQVVTSDHVGRWAHRGLPEPEMVRVVHGLSADVDAVGSLGNAVVPQIPEMIAIAIRDLYAT